MRYIIIGIIVLLGAITAIAAIPLVSQTLNIALIDADTANTEAQTELTHEETNQELVDLLTALTEQNQETNAKLLEIVAELSRPNNTLLIIVVVLASTLTLASMLLVVSAILIVMLSKKDKKETSPPQIAPVTAAPQLNPGQWRMITGEYMESAPAPVMRESERA